MDARPALERTSQGAVADEGERALAAVVRTRAPAAARSSARSASLRRRMPSPPAATRSRRGPPRVCGCESVQVDAAVDHLDPAAGLGHDRLESRAQPSGDGNDSGGAPNRGPGRRRATAERVAFSTSCPCAVTTTGAPPRRTRADPPARGSARRRRPVGTVARWRPRPREHDVTKPASAPVDHGPRELVAALESRSSRSATNVPSSGASGPGYICETSRMRTLRGYRG